MSIRPIRYCAVVLTYERVQLCELLAMLDRQTRPMPVLFYVDHAPELAIELANAKHDWRVAHACEEPSQNSVGLVRRAAIEDARQWLSLDADDVVIVLDDDDFYCSRHFELTIQALGPRAWTGALAMGLETHPNAAPIYVSGQRGPGQHATWAYRLRQYDAAGGYQDTPSEDVALGFTMGWDSCTPHWFCTHVRRHHPANLSGPTANHDRARMRAVSATVAIASPRWTARCEELERWCAQQLAR